MPITQVLADEDTFNDENTPTTNYNTDSEIKALKFTSINRHGFIRLNLTPLLPPGAAIISCKYYLYVKGGTGGTHTINFHECTQPTAVFSELTWDHYRAGVPWTTPGGDKGSLKGTCAAPDPGLWGNVDLTTYANDQFTAGNPMFLIASMDTGSTEKRWYSKDYVHSSYRAYFEIEYTMSNLSAIGKFRLGYAQLGTAFGSVSHTESIKASDSTLVNTITFLSESVECQDQDWVEMIASLAESTKLLSEFLYYPVFNQVGVQVRIIQPIDITMEDFCDHVYEAGHSILLNGANARAFVNIKQSEQTFRGNVKIFPGDAVMFSCPELIIKKGDIITHAFREYEILEIHEKLIGGNYIYLKSALRLLTIPVLMPKVTGLKVSENLDGTVLLTWDNITKTAYPSFDHFEIWRSGTHPITGVDQGLKTFDIDGEYAEFFTAGETFSIIDSTGNDGTYTIVTADETSGTTTIEVSEVIPSAIADGRLDEMLFRLVATSKNATHTDKNLTEGATYHYKVRAIDKYANTGTFSDIVSTTGDTDSPAKPEGFR